MNYILKYIRLGFPGGTVVENPPADAGDMGSIPALGSPHMPQTRPMSHNCWGCPLEPGGHNYWAQMLRLLKPCHLDLCPATEVRSPHTSKKSSPPYFLQLEKQAQPKINRSWKKKSISFKWSGNMLNITCIISNFVVFVQRLCCRFFLSDEHFQ